MYDDTRFCEDSGGGKKGKARRGRDGAAGPGRCPSRSPPRRQDGGFVFSPPLMWVSTVSWDLKSFWATQHTRHPDGTYVVYDSHLEASQSGCALD